MVPALKIILSYALPHIVKGVMEYFSQKEKSEAILVQEEIVDNIRREIELMFIADDPIPKRKKETLIKRLREESRKLAEMSEG